MNPNLLSIKLMNTLQFIYIDKVIITTLSVFKPIQYCSTNYEQQIDISICVNKFIQLKSCSSDSVEVNLLLVILRSVTPTRKAMNSANGTVNHTPLVPRNLGSNVIPAITNTIPRLIETKKDDLASPSDVKYPDITILILTHSLKICKRINVEINDQRIANRKSKKLL